MAVTGTAVRTAETAESPAKVKILLVDDRPENLVSLVAALEALGQELVCAHSGREALRYLLEDNFAAILLDVRMPDMDGFETAELIRSRPRSRHVPILFLTGYKSEEHLFRGYDLGAVDFLFKPIVPEVLRSKVAAFVELSRKAELLEKQAAVLREQAATLQKAEQQFRSLLEAAPDAMIICDASGRIALVNSRTEGMFGYPRAELLTRHIRTLVPSWRFELPDDEGPPAPFAHASELDAVRRDDSVFPVEISISPLRSEDGLLITTAIRDITARRQAEEKVRQLNAHLEQLNAHLEDRVIERTEALMRSNDELAQFAYIASHDLQEPLRTVVIYTQLISSRLGQSLSPETRKFMEYITESAHRMEQLIRDILEYSQVEASGTMRSTPVDCSETLREALANLRGLLEESDAVVESESLPSVSGDRLQLSRLFQNLVGNAVRYAHPGRAPRVRISASEQAESWLIAVEDNGIGIEPQYREKVFGIFKRLHGRDIPGTGMGLAICRKIVTRHGGRIWVESTPGVGSTFFFTLAKNRRESESR